MEGFVIMLVLLLLAIFLVPLIFFLLQLQKLLNACTPGSRQMDPGMVWLNLIPLFSLGWMIYTVIKIRDTLKIEFPARNIETDDPEFCFPIGLAMGICSACSIIPFINYLTGIASLVLMIIYWIKMHKYTTILESNNLIQGNIKIIT